MITLCALQEYVRLEWKPRILECLSDKAQIQGLKDFSKLTDLICLGTITMCTLGFCFTMFHFILVDWISFIKLRGSRLRGKKWDGSVQVVLWSLQSMIEQVKGHGFMDSSILLQGPLKILYSYLFLGPNSLFEMSFSSPA